MIALYRSLSKDAIHPNFCGNKRTRFNMELLTDQRSICQGVQDKHAFKQARWKAAKAQLYAETVNKCAYCEAPTKVVAHGDVEHYRPKSRYWWLAYCYHNYLISCAVCNELFKADEFPTASTPLASPAVSALSLDTDIKTVAPHLTPDPLDDAAGMPWTAFQQLSSRERPLLINPYETNPEEFFAYEANDVLREVSIVSLNERVSRVVDNTVRVYGLNRPELLDLRYQLFFLYDTFRLTLTEPQISLPVRQRNQTAIERMKEAAAPFAGMIRYFDRVLRVPVGTAAMPA